MRQRLFSANFGISILLTALSAYFLLSMSSANAQTSPRFLVSWKAVNFFPSDYSEKVPVTNGSRVEIGFDLIDKNKTVNLTENEISWFVNNELIAQKNGLKSVSFNAVGNSPQNIKIIVSNYQDTELEESIVIPVTGPKITIDSRTPVKYVYNRTELPFKNYIFELRPFFFNVNDLSELDLKWRVNGDLSATDPENPEFLILDLTSDGTPKQTGLELSASAGNKYNILELAGKKINYWVK